MIDSGDSMDEHQLLRALVHYNREKYYEGIFSSWESYGLPQRVVIVVPRPSSQEKEEPIPEKEGDLTLLKRENAQLRVALGQLQLENLDLKEALTKAQTALTAPVVPKRKTCFKVKSLMEQLKAAGITTPEGKPLEPSPDCRCDNCIKAAFAELEVMREHFRKKTTS
jgi:hypothetical protein